MLNERDEFLLSRVPDGDLNEDENAHVQTLLASSAAAREIAAQYERLTGTLAAERLPEMDLSGGRHAIFAALNAESRAVQTRQPSFWQQSARRVAIAAALLVGVTLSIHYFVPHSPSSNVEVADGAGPAGTMNIAGPNADSSTGTMTLSVGPSPSIANVTPEQLYPNELNRGRPRVMVAPESAPAKDANGHDPF